VNGEVDVTRCRAGDERVGGICVVVTARLWGSTIAATTSTWPGVEIERSTVSAAAF